ncbi:MAG: glycoside hydrolase family 65 protein [Halanaerobiales bacterium]|nr:glycoside hydrolase family 65 protein [Halanaerobiales bacterium]
MVIEYNKGSNEYKNWIISESEFKTENQAKFETIFSLGNGYMGARASLEEKTPGETRGFYLAGIFDKYPGEVTEMPNLPDWIQTDIYINGEKFNIYEGKVHQYSRYLNLKEGTLIRDFIWENNKGEMIRFNFERIISMANLHTAIAKVNIQPINFSGKIEIVSGINGRVSNSGTQHLKEGVKRLIEDDIVYIPETQKSKVKLFFSLGHNVIVNDNNSNIEKDFIAGRRILKRTFKFDFQKNDNIEIYKYLSVYSSRDKDIDGNLETKTLNNLKKIKDKGYNILKKEHIDKWSSIWNDIDIKISGSDYDQLAIRFALFHLVQMTPDHDARISIAAKGLSGEGYKGHVFWDTEIFILPFYIYNYPKIARSLLKYRYNTLDGARKKAKDNGYKGAMFAWESAKTGEETTPKYGAVDILTGEEIRIWSGELEQHITVDIQYAIDQYFKVTDDFDFMKNYGFEIFFESTRFWSSRLEYNEEKDYFEINNVMGPDEYKEHVDNNAFINYMVYWQFEKALKYIRNLKEENPTYYKKLKDKINLNEKEIQKWKSKKEKIYLPQPNKENIISQYEGYQELPEIDLKKYKNGDVGEIFNEFGWEEIINSKVTKQADVVMLTYLLEDNFDPEIIKDNYDFYEPLTLHDSSLSPAIHAAVGSRLGNAEEAYNLFQRAARIDLGENMKSSDEGLHSASLGGLWQAIVFGFAGLEFKNQKIYLNPHLPNRWNMVSFKIKIRANEYQITITKEKICIKEIKTKDKISFVLNGKEQQINGECNSKY